MRSGNKNGRGLVGVMVTLVIIAIVIYLYFKNQPSPAPAGSDQQQAAQMRQEALANPQKAFDKTKETIKKDEDGRVKAVNDVVQ